MHDKLSNQALSVDLSKLANPQDLNIGLYDGTVHGSGVTNVTLTIEANSHQVLSQDFASAAAAAAYFTNDAIDLGPLVGYGAALNLQVDLSVTSVSPGSGFYGNLLIGDPLATSASHHTALTINGGNAPLTQAELQLVHFSNGLDHGPATLWHGDLIF